MTTTPMEPSHGDSEQRRIVAADPGPGAPGHAAGSDLTELEMEQPDLSPARSAAEDADEGELHPVQDTPFHRPEVPEHG